MARTILQDVDRVMASKWYAAWALLHGADATKIKLERQGKRRPLSQDSWARTFIEAIRVGLEWETPPPPPPPPAPSLFTRFGYLRGPRSGSETEKLAELAVAGYRMIALNVGDHAPDEWAPWRATDMAVIPWARVHTMTEMSALAAIAKAWNAPGLIANLEQEATEPRWLMTGTQAAQALVGFTGQVGVSTECWMPENFDWFPLIQRGAVCLPQTHAIEFPQFPPKVVVDRAKVFGWANPVPSFGTYDHGGQTPHRADYDWQGSFGIYTVDDVAPSEIPDWV